MGTDIELQVPPPRQPLGHRRIASPSQLQVKQIRRKGSFVHHADSSEEPASSHGSIYEAHYFSEDSGEKAESYAMANLVPGNQSLHNDENIALSSPIDGFDESAFLYGRGTVLGTITEQKSYGTMRSISHTRSADDLHNIYALAHRDNALLAKIPRRRSSFSLDDLAITSKSYHDAVALIDMGGRGFSKASEIYAEPKAPIQRPPERPSTPPGMPSWTESQNLPLRNRRVLLPQNRIQRFFGLPGSEITLPSGIPNRTSSGSAVRAAPRFRPPRSAYGPIEQHPFTRAPIASHESPINSTLNAAAASNPRPISKLEKLKGRRTRGQRVHFTNLSGLQNEAENNPGSHTMSSNMRANLAPRLMSPMRPVPQHRDPQRIKCPHRKGRRAAMRALRQDVPTSSLLGRVPSPVVINESPRHSILHTPRRFSLSLHPPNIQGYFNPARRNTIIDQTPYLAEPESPDPSTFASSATHLMTGGLPSPTPEQTGEPDPPPSHCWKCKVNAIIQKLDSCWAHGAKWFCYICCGFEIDDGTDTTPNYRRMVASGSLFSNSGTDIGSEHRPRIESCVGRQTYSTSQRAVLDATPAVMG